MSTLDIVLLLGLASAGACIAAMLWPFSGQRADGVPQVIDSASIMRALRGCGSRRGLRRKLARAAAREIDLLAQLSEARRRADQVATTIARANSMQEARDKALIHLALHQDALAEIAGVCMGAPWPRGHHVDPEAVVNQVHISLARARAAERQVQ